jgi:hypothetical protein
MLIGVLIMSVLVVAAGVLLFTTAPDASDTPASAAEVPPTVSIPGDDGNTSLQGDPVPPSPPPTVEVSVSPDPPPPAEVRTVTIVYGSRNRVMTDFTASVNETVPLRVRIEPLGAEGEIVWASSNRSVFDVVRTAARVTGIGRGTAELTVTVGGVTAVCIVRVRQ